MRIILLILFFGFTTAFAQKKDSTATKDSMEVKVISAREMGEYIERINAVAMKQFDLTEAGEYQFILNELRAIWADVERKRKSNK